MAISPPLVVTDLDNANLQGATIWISNGLFSGDNLGFTTQNGITGSYNSGTAVLTLSGSASVVNYQAALRSVTFSSSSHNPTDSGSKLSRTISFTANDGSSTNAPVTSTVSITPLNDPPTISSIVNQTVSEDTSTAGLAFTIGDADTPLASLIVTATSSNPTLIPGSNIILGGTGANRTVTVTPATNQSGGPVTITLTVNDGAISTSTTFTVTVIPVNDPPTLESVADRAINEDAGVQTVNLTGISAGGGETQTLTVTALSGNTSLIPHPIVTYTSPNATGSLSFTPVADASGTALITATVNDGGASNNITTRTFTVTVNPVNDAPTISSIADQTINEDAGVQTVNLTGISAGGGETQTLTITAISGNTSLIPNPTVTYTSPNATGSLSFTPVADASGRALITVTINDGGLSNNITTRTFTVTVIPVNDAPTITAIADQTINEDAGVQTVNLTGISAGGGETQTLTVTAISGNTSLIPNPTVTYISPNATGSLSFTPVANASGTALITVTVNDGGLSNNITTRTFTVTVIPVNDPPTLESIADRTINEDAGVQTVNLTGISAGGGETQTLTVTAISGNTSLIPNPTVTYTSPNATGSLSFTPVADASGTALITVTVNDGGLSNNITTRTFTVTVNPVNDAPTITAIADQTINEDAGVQTVNLTGISAGGGENQTLTVSASSGNTSLIPNPTVTYTSPNATGSLSFTPAADASGTALITVTVNDGGASNNITTRTFTVKVIPVNDPPTITAIADQTINEDAGVQTVNLSGISAGGGETQTLTVSVSSGNTSLIPNPIMTYTSPNATGSLSFKPVADASGTALITVTVNDGGSSNNIATRTFTVTVRPVNDFPQANDDVLSPIEEDSEPRIIQFGDLTRNDATGPPNESDQTLTIISVTNAVGGSVAISGLNVVFTPTPDYNGPAGFSYTVRDNGTTGGEPDPLTATGRVSFIITEVNDPPIARVSPLGGVLEGSVQTVPISVFLANDSPGPANESNQTLTLIAVGGAVGGTARIEGTNVIVTLDPNFNGPGQFFYTIQDNGTTDGKPDFKTATATVTADVIPVNDPPVAQSASVSVNEDSTVVITLKGDDGDPEVSQVLTFAITAAPQHGRILGFNPASGALVYLPATNYTGPDSFQFTVTDDATAGEPPNLTSAAGTVTLTVNPEPDAPTVTSATTQEGRQTLSGLVITRNALDGSEVTHFEISQIRNGTLYQNDGITVIADGTFVSAGEGLAGLKFTPTAGLYSPGADFGFEVQAALNDAGLGLSVPTLALITVNPNLDFGDAPAPYPTLLAEDGARHVVLSTGSSLFLGLKGPDVEADGQPSPLADGDNLSGSDDEDGVVLPAKIIAGQNYTVGIVVSGFGLINGWIDWNRDGDWNDEGEQVFVNQAVGAGTNFFELPAPAALLEGTSFARFRLSTQSGLEPVGLAKDGEVEDYSVNLVINHAPQANPDTYEVAEGGLLFANDPDGQNTPGQSNDNGVLANDTDADGDVLIASILTPPRFAATFHLNENGTFIYEHDGSENLSDSFTYQVSDGVGGTSDAVATITITEVNDAPTISNIASQTIPEDTNTAVLAFTIGDIDSPIANLTVGVASSDTTLIPVNQIVLGGSGTNRTVSVTPATNQNGGPVTITLTVSDGALNTSTTFTVMVTEVNDPPILSEDTLSSIAEDSGPRNIPLQSTSKQRSSRSLG